MGVGLGEGRRRCVHAVGLSQARKCAGAVANKAIPANMSTGRCIFAQTIDLIKPCAPFSFKARFGLTSSGDLSYLISMLSQTFYALTLGTGHISYLDELTTVLANLMFHYDQ